MVTVSHSRVRPLLRVEAPAVRHGENGLPIGLRIGLHDGEFLFLPGQQAQSKVVPRQFCRPWVMPGAIFHFQEVFHYVHTMQR